MSEETLLKLQGEMRLLLEDIGARLERLEERLQPRATCLSLVDAAKQLGVSLSTMKRMVATREIHTATVGKRSMIPVSELARVSTPDPKRPAQQKAAKAAAWVPVPKKRAGR